MPASTLSFTELEQLEAGDLRFAGYVFDDRVLIPVLLKSQHSQQERRRRILRLNGRAEDVERHRGDVRADPEQLLLWKK